MRRVATTAYTLVLLGATMKQMMLYQRFIISFSGSSSYHAAVRQPFQPGFEQRDDA